MLTDEIIIAQTKKWITDVVSGCNFCPFVARELKRGSVFYKVMPNANDQEVLEMCDELMRQLNDEPDTETTLLILPSGRENFTNYLALVDLAEAFIAANGYEGIYQVASFHPQYLFAGSNDEDPANYTNRSPYPMLHFLRESSVTKAVDTHPDIDAIPMDNISFTREKGLRYMQQLLAACM